MTPERLRPHVEAWIDNGGVGRIHLVHLDGSWTGTEQLLVGDQYVDVRVCPSELAVREELTRTRPDGRTAVLLCPAEIRADDLLARVAKRRVLHLRPWEAVQHLFAVGRVDPLLLEEKWMAEALVEAAPPGGYEASGAQALDAERAWRALLHHRFGLDADGGLLALIEWAAGPEPARLGERGEDERAAVTERLSTRIDGARPVLALAATGHGDQACPLGLVMRAVLDGPEGDARTAARTLLGVELRGWTFHDADARAWAQAAEAHVVDLLDSDAPQGHAILQAADQAVGRLKAESLVGVSDLLSAGLRARLRDLAAALGRRAGGEAEPGEIDRAARRVVRHRLTDHRDVATMTARLVRWLDTPDGDVTGFHELAAAHASDHAYADRARTALRGGTGEAELDDRLRALVAEADERRAGQDRTFAAKLAQHVGHAAAGGPVLGVEEVLDRVVAPLAAQRRLLLVVLDGMSHRVAGDLLEDVVARGWIELRSEDDPGRALVLAALPSVTGFSRTSLLSGALTQGTAPDEAKAFALHNGLLKASAHGGPPLLLHKGALKDPHGGLAAELRSELAGERRVVGVVVNAIDDHLAKDDQLAAPWSATYVPLLRLLLEAASDADRLVVLGSDHGHVLDRNGSKHDGGPDHGERYRSAARSTDPGEQLVEGTRVLVGSGRCVLAVDEDVRYATRKHGYHGGGSPQEVLAPLMVITPGPIDALDGWAESTYDPPAWWAEPAPEPAVTTPTTPPSTEEPGGQLTLGADHAAPTASAWIADALASETFAARRAAVSRGRVPDERVAAILAALDAAGGTLLAEALGRRVGLPALRLRGTLASMSQLLNIDGYPVLEVREDTSDVVLNVPLLREQFGLGEGS